MEYPIGIEMAPDYLAYEVNKAAYKLVKEMMLIEPGENVVVTGDTSTDKRVLDAIMNAAYIVGANPVLVYVPTNEKAYAEPVAGKCSGGSGCVDGIVLFVYHAMLGLEKGN